MSLSYELLKEIKDAGFPFREWHVDDGISTQIIWEDVESPISKEPTLEELIEWCGRKFDYLERGTKGDWYAYHEVWRDDDVDAASDDVGEGSTPKEAVARLGIAIHKK